jgi:hypothetical protein
VPGLSLAHHSRFIVGSGISDTVARARGYRTVVEPTEVRDLGFGPEVAAHVSGANPALLIPLFDPQGREAGYQLRPDLPVVREGGVTAKYESLPGSRPVLDVPRGYHLALNDASNPLLITEGARKADAVVTAVAAALRRSPTEARNVIPVSLNGVAGWRGRNEHDQRSVALPAWREMPLGGRTVYLAFDSDLNDKSAVHRELRELRDYLTGKGAAVSVVYLPSGDGGAKVGVDDFLAAGHTLADLLHLAEPRLRPVGHEGQRLWSAVELLAQQEPMPWLIGAPAGERGDGLLPADGLSCLFGLPGTGKSFVALDLAAHIVHGRPWCGRTVRPGPVVFIYAEGKQGLPQRLQAWNATNGGDLDALAGLRFLPSAQDLTEPAVVASLIERIGEARPALIVVDTLARAMPGRNENDAMEMGLFVGACDRLRTEYGCNVLAIHHKNREGKLRGSSAFDAALDTLIEVERTGDDLALRVTKQKDAGPVRVDLALRPVGDSLVIVPTGPHAQVVVLTAPQRQMLERLAEATDTARAALFKDLGGSIRTLVRALDDLVERGLVLKAGRGAYQRAPTGSRALMEGRAGTDDGNPKF